MAVENDVPIPKAKNGRTFEYHFAELDLGQSFFVAGNHRLKKTVTVAATRQGRRLSRRFVTRFLEDGIRVWRVE